MSHELRENIEESKMLQPSSLYLTPVRNKKSSSVSLSFFNVQL